VPFYNKKRNQKKSYIEHQQRRQCFNIMCNQMKHFITVIASTLTISAFSQETSKPLTKRVIVKTNLLSLVAQQPTVTIEKVFSNKFSAEVAFVQGRFNNVLLTNHYNYNGFLIRAKKQFANVDFGNVTPYAAVYVGNLKRNIQTTGEAIGSSGWIGYPSRKFSASSVRGGGTLGLCYISNRKIVVDGLMSLGYGTYTKVYKPGVNSSSTGYLDAQVWLSIGYCF
jgi:hypothetical protein